MSMLCLSYYVYTSGSLGCTRRSTVPDPRERLTRLQILFCNKLRFPDRVCTRSIFNHRFPTKAGLKAQQGGKRRWTRNLSADGSGFRFFCLCRPLESASIIKKQQQKSRSADIRSVIFCVHYMLLISGDSVARLVSPVCTPCRMCQVFL